MAIPLLVPIIMAAVSAASSIAGGVIGSKENRKNQTLYNKRNAELEKDLYSGPLNDAGSQAYLRTIRENLNDTIQGIENSAVSTGATQENVLAQKEAANRVVSDATANLLQREDNKRYALLGRRDALDQQQVAINNQRAANWQQIASGISNAASALGSAYMMGEEKLFDTPTGASSTNTRLASVMEDTTDYGAKMAQESLNNTIEQNVRGWEAKPLTINIR